MKKIFFVLMVLLFNINIFSDVAHAANKETEIELDGEYKVKSKEVELFQATSTFSTDDYTKGLFDKGEHIGSTTFGKSVYDNNLSTGENQLPGTVVFNKKMNITGVYLNFTFTQGSSGSTSRTGTVTTYCYDEKDAEISKTVTDYSNRYYAIKCKDAKKVSINFSLAPINYTYKMMEVELFGEPSKIYSAVTDVVAKDITHNSFNVEYKNPVDEDLIANEIYLDNVLVHSGSVVSSYSFKDLAQTKKYNLKINTVYRDGQKVSFETSVTTLEKVDPPPDVTDLKIIYENDAAKLTYVIPKDATSVKIYKNSALLDEVTTNSYSDKNVEAGRSYTYKVIAINKHGQSVGVTASITIPSKEVAELKAKATADRVDLSWKLPTVEGLSHVVIYRSNLSQSSVNRMFKSLFSNNEKALFETNGTYFNDLTVESETKYRYRVASVYGESTTDGVSIEVTTLKIKVEGGNVTENNGDYTVTWTSPTKGKIKIFVGGKLYATVDAATKKYVIPGKDMKYTPLGSPDIKLVQVGEDGKEGEVTSPGGSEMPPIDGIFDGNDLLKVGVQLLALIGGFVLLALAFRVVPKLVNLITNAFNSGGSSPKKDLYIPKQKRRVEQ